MNIALIGMMGTMKSAVGRALSKLTGRQLCDTDDIFEKENGMKISEAFDNLGESFFREKETLILAALVGKTDVIISCGGGVPTIATNRKLLEKCKTVLLTAEAKEIYCRLKGDSTRPLLRDMSVDKITAIMNARKDAYESAADIIIATDGKTPVEIATKIKQKAVL